MAAIPRGTDVNEMQFMKYGNAPKTMLESFHENIVVAKEKDELSIIDVTCHAHIFGRPRGAYYYEKIVAAAGPARTPQVRGGRPPSRPASQRHAPHHGGSGCVAAQRPRPQT